MILKILFLFFQGQVNGIENCLNNELRCKAAIVKNTICFEYKTNVVTNNNKNVEFDRHAVSSIYNGTIFMIYSDFKFGKN